MDTLENLGFNEPLTIAERFYYLWLTNAPFYKIQAAAIALSTRWSFLNSKTARHDYTLFIFGDGSAVALHMKRSHLPIVFKQLTTNATPHHKIKETKAAA